VSRTLKPGLLNPATWLKELKRGWMLYHLADPRFKFIYDHPPEDEWVALDCETTGLNVLKDEIVSIGAVRIKGNRILTSERLELIVRPEKRKLSAESIKVHRLRQQDVAQGLPPEEAIKKLMHFVGSRPLVGYYLEFDVAMINRVMWPWLGVHLPQAKVEVSAMYYDYKNKRLPLHLQGGDIDLRFASLMRDLDLPLREAHDALNDAVMAAMAFIKLRSLHQSIVTVEVK
jgi:DNA polymerase-3 subunit epsilon